MNRQDWARLSFLDALRPEPGWRTDFALLATYSVDLVALVAALLALAGLDDERGSGSKVDFANAIDALRDRVRLVAQSGRIVAPSRTPKVLGILDRFVREVAMNEAQGSWHPKAALVRLNADAGRAVQWRFWFGSRNLTRDLSWDVGLLLVGHEGAEGRAVPGVPELGRELADRGGLRIAQGRHVFEELRAVRWQMPPGCSVEELRLLLGERVLPDPPREVKKLLVISPFLDGGVVGEFGRWGDERTRRTLVSTRAELGKLASQAGQPLERFRDLLYLEAPGVDVSATLGADDQDAPASEDEEPEAIGLHAKIVYAEYAGGRSLWIGSANATRRGWKGPNAEIVARLSVNGETASGLESFVEEMGRTVDVQMLSAPELDETEELLEAARRQVAGRWAVAQRIADGQPVLEAEAAPHPDDPEIALAVGLLGQPMVEWPRTERVLRLAAVPAGEVTEFVRCRLSLGASHVTWIQRAPMDPAPGDERDSDAIARFLDPRTFLLWIRSLLVGDPLTSGGGDWDAPASRESRPARPDGPVWWAPTIEEVLKAWARCPDSVADVDRKVRRYLDATGDATKGDGTEEERGAIAEFRSTWEVLRRGLIGGSV